jgi:hypothetical protein
VVDVPVTITSAARAPSVVAARYALLQDIPRGGGLIVADRKPFVSLPGRIRRYELAVDSGTVWRVAR